LDYPILKLLRPGRNIGSEQLIGLCRWKQTIKIEIVCGSVMSYRKDIILMSIKKSLIRQLLINNNTKELILDNFFDLDDQLIAIRSQELIDLLKFRVKSGKPLKESLLNKIIEVGNLTNIIHIEQSKMKEKT